MKDRALEIAYSVHRAYLDADSADCGPIEDYIAEAIRGAARRCAEIADGVAQTSDDNRSRGPLIVAEEIRLEFGVAEDAQKGTP